jgi:hypothetical protein
MTRILNARECTLLLAPDARLGKWRATPPCTALMYKFDPPIFHLTGMWRSNRDNYLREAGYSGLGQFFAF